MLLRIGAEGVTDRPVAGGPSVSITMTAPESTSVPRLPIRSRPEKLT